LLRAPWIAWLNCAKRQSRYKGKKVTTEKSTDLESDRGFM
jgi:hypothetical protein